MVEIWKDIPGFEGFYQASTAGRIRSVDRSVTDAKGVVRFYRGRMMTLCDAGSGYLNVSLSKQGKLYTPRVNRVIAQTFLENPCNYDQVNHKDENKRNNCVANLEWCTAKYNTNYGTGILRRAQAISRPVLQFDPQGNFIKRWESITQAERELGIDNSHITRCCKKRLKTTGGFAWRYAEEEGEKE